MVGVACLALSFQTRQKREQMHKARRLRRWRFSWEQEPEWRTRFLCYDSKRLGHEASGFWVWPCQFFFFFIWIFWISKFVGLCAIAFLNKWKNCGTSGSARTRGDTGRGTHARSKARQTRRRRSCVRDKSRRFHRRVKAKPVSPDARRQV